MLSYFHNLKIEEEREKKRVVGIGEREGCCSVTQLCLTLSNLVDSSTPGFPVLHHPPEFAQTQVHWVDDTIQPSHPLSPPSFCSQSFPASGSFPMSLLFASGGEEGQYRDRGQRDVNY